MRIALAEPSRTVRRIVSGTLEAWGHEVCSFTDAQEVLTALQQDNSIRALITSAELASSSGVLLVKDARTLAGSQRPLYLILMSSSDERAKMVQALDNGADDFISKPPALEELRARLRAADRITSMQAELISIATTDSLTGLLTRRAFVEAAGTMSASAQRGHPLTVLMCDLDKFKSINDSYGHDVGDVVLQSVGREAKTFGVPAGRLGGEKFALLLEKRLDDAIELAEQLRESIGELKICAGDQTLAITCSIGVAEWEPGDTIDMLLRRADVSLYEAKRSGRNRVIAADTFSVSTDRERWRGSARLAKHRAGTQV